MCIIYSYAYLRLMWKHNTFTFYLILCKFVYWTCNLQVLHLTGTHIKVRNCLFQMLPFTTFEFAMNGPSNSRDFSVCLLRMWMTLSFIQFMYHLIVTIYRKSLTFISFRLLRMTLFFTPGTFPIFTH